MCGSHVNEALRMEGVCSWADHFKPSIHKVPSYSLQICLGNLKKTYDGWNRCLQDEGVDCSSHRMRAFVWTLKVPMGSPKYPMEFPGEIFYWKRKERSGNLENPIQMLSYNQLNWISFQCLVLIICKIIMTKTKIIHTNYRIQISLIYMYTWILKF